AQTPTKVGARGERERGQESRRGDARDERDARGKERKGKPRARGGQARERREERETTRHATEDPERGGSGERERASERRGTPAQSETPELRGTCEGSGNGKVQRRISYRLLAPDRILWLKMSLDSDKACGMLSQNSTTSCVFQAADEKDDMLSYSKFSVLETWLCMPSTLLPGALESTTSTSTVYPSTLLPGALESTNSTSSASTSTARLSTCSETGETDTPHRPLERETMFLTPALGWETLFLATPLAPILSSTPCNMTPVTSAMTSVTSSGDSASQGRVSVRKRRRLAASPRGLQWNSTGRGTVDLKVPSLNLASARNKIS
ncbi:unnamed protein product, partial [Coregonus sp. 'balchen']